MLSRLTAYAIANNPSVIATAGGPAENGKFVGWITLGPEDYCRPLINTEPIYDTIDEAKQAMRDLIVVIKEWVAKDMADPDNPIMAIMDGPEGELIQKIVSAAKGRTCECES